MRRGVIIANTGSPASPAPEDVRAYLSEFLSNRRIVPVNPLIWKIVLNRSVLPKRTYVSGLKYAMIWEDGAFPLIRDSLALAKMLEESFAADGQDVLVRAAMSFGEPSVPGAMRELAEAGCEGLDVLPLYPQNAFSQASIVADAVAEHLAETGWGSGEHVRIVGDYSANVTYLSAVADSIRATGFGESADDRIVFGFHSIPRVDVENGDTYERNVALTCDWLARELGIADGNWSVGFQCRFDKGRKWLDPFSRDVLDLWQAEGFEGRVFYVCPNFSIDCLETKYDVEGVFKTVWLGRRMQAGLPIREDSFVYVPCLGATEAHVRVIRDVLAAE